MMRKTKGNKKSPDEESESSLANNAFAAAMDEALNDDGEGNDDIFETTEENKNAKSKKEA